MKNTSCKEIARETLSLCLAGRAPAEFPEAYSQEFESEIIPESELALGLRAQFAAGVAGETGVHTADAAIPAKDERGRPAIQIDGLRQLFVKFARLAG